MAIRTRRAPRSSATVLVVEHDHATRRLYREVLAAAGYEAIAVEDGIGALLYLESHPAPDAVVLNVMLPRVPARVVYEDLRSRKTTRTVPLVLVGGPDADPFEPDEHITMVREPLDGNTLVAAVASALGRAPESPVS